MSKLSELIVNERLSSRGIMMMGEYVNANIQSSFRCSEGHSWAAKPGQVLHGSGCPVCSGLMPLSKTIINSRLSDSNRNIDMMGDYVNTGTKTLFQCLLNHEWLARPRDVLSGTGCPHCAGRAPLSKNVINERLDERNITLIGEYIKSHSKALFKCGENHEWMATPHNVIQGYGCPQCANHGFNPAKLATIYLLDFGTYIKYGISNDIKRRLSAHKKSGNYVIIMMAECSGDKARNWETMIKKKFGGKFIDSTIMANGHTETLSPIYKQSILETIKEIQC